MAERPASELPEDPGYWDELATRITQDAAGPLAGYAQQDLWYGALARRAPWVAAASVAAILLLWLSLPGSDPGAGVFRSIERALAPDDPAGVLVAGESAPPVATLMAEFPPAMHGEQR
ncbi:MAG: hypothetical protein GKS06_03455 [Acidobacteria bacterium]|nr:hypothetical protein [Acidobacteriota bacterium]